MCKRGVALRRLTLTACKGKQKTDIPQQQGHYAVASASFLRRKQCFVRLPAPELAAEDDDDCEHLQTPYEHQQGV